VGVPAWLTLGKWPAEPELLGWEYKRAQCVHTSSTQNRPGSIGPRPVKLKRKVAIRQIKEEPGNFKGTLEMKKE